MLQNRCFFKKISPCYFSPEWHISGRHLSTLIIMEFFSSFWNKTRVCQKHNKKKNWAIDTEGSFKKSPLGDRQWDWFWRFHVICEGTAYSFASGLVVLFVRTPGYSQRSVVFFKSQTHRQRWMFLGVLWRLDPGPGSLSSVCPHLSGASEQWDHSDVALTFFSSFFLLKFLPF